MNKTTCYEVGPNECLAVDLPRLMALLSLGRAASEEIAVNAGAVIKIGRRKIYNVKKIEAYLYDCAQ